MNKPTKPKAPAKIEKSLGYSANLSKIIAKIPADVVYDNVTISTSWRGTIKMRYRISTKEYDKQLAQYQKDLLSWQLEQELESAKKEQKKLAKKLEKTK